MVYYLLLTTSLITSPSFTSTIVLVLSNGCKIFTVISLLIFFEIVKAVPVTSLFHKSRIFSLALPSFLASIIPDTSDAACSTNSILTILFFSSNVALAKCLLELLNSCKYLLIFGIDNM